MIRDRIFETPVYEGFDVSAYRIDFVYDRHPGFQHVIETVKPSVIVEVGSWKGGSAIHMAELCKAYHLNTEIICVDTWLGATEHWENKNEQWGIQNLKIIHGRPNIYYQFLANVILCGHDDVITPLSMSSSSAAFFLKNMGIMADFIYIDAGHNYDDVYSDLKNYWSILRPGGILLGDDFQSKCVDIVTAAQDFARLVDHELFVNFPKFLLRKKPDAS